MDSKRLIANADEQARIIALADAEKRDLSLSERTALDELQANYEAIEHASRLRAKHQKIEAVLNTAQSPAHRGITPFGPDDPYNDDDDDDARTSSTPVEWLRSGRSRTDDTSSTQHLARNKWRTSPKPFSQNPARLDSGGFNSFGEFLRTVSGSSRGISDDRLKRLAMSEGVGADGGFAVPLRYSAELFDTAAMLAPYLAMRHNIEVLGGPSIIFPRVSDHDQSAGEIAGFAMGRTSEGAAVSEDTIILEQLNATLTKASKLVVLSNELLDDAVPGTIDRLEGIFARSLALLQVDNLVNGSGAGEPLGILNAPATYSQTTSTAAGSIDLLDIANMVSRLQPGDDTRTAWLCHPSVLPALITMVSAASSSIEPVWIASARDGRPRELLGYPLFVCGACPQLNNAGDIILARLSEYLYVNTRLAIDIDRSYKFGNDQTTYRIKIRDAGMPIDSTTFTDLSAWSQASFVKLATRS